MMFLELLKLTDNQATYEQFLDIEAAYMAKESMTKKQASALWNRRYGQKEEKPIPAYLKEVKIEYHSLLKETGYILDFENNFNYFGTTTEEHNAVVLGEFYKAMKIIQR